jgi:ankyrin repeat protein
LVNRNFSNHVWNRFQWVFCQLEALRHLVQPDVRAVVEKLPKTLDETYERILKDIKENNREHALRLLHCLAVAVRPLRVEELAEILTFDFDTAQGSIPKFHADRRPVDEEAAVLSLCSSLITIVDSRGSRVVQFSHLSVKEFLTSNHLASSAGPLTSYHILPGPAHTILAQVCLGLLLHVDDNNDNKSIKDSPLVKYAARHWIAHVQFEDVALRVEDGMRSLFDPDRPHFATWIGLYDIDAGSAGKLPSEIPSPLYYSALLGFHGLVRHISITHPEQVNAIGGSFGFPLVAALCKNHFAVADLLLEHGGRVDVRDQKQQTALHKTIERPGKVAPDALRFLLEHSADVNSRRDDLWTPLHLAVNIGELSVTRMLLERQADVNSRNCDGQTPLHLLSRREASQDEDDSGSEIAKLLLERGANVNEKDKDNATPLHLASYNRKLEIVRVLLDHGANADAEKAGGETPVRLALRGNRDAHEDDVSVAQMILSHGVEAYARDKYHISTSDLACCFGEKLGQFLLGGGAKSKPKEDRDQRLFWLWIEGEYPLTPKN